MTPVGPDYPSAVAALNGTGLPMGFTGASRSSMCNPKSANYQARRGYDMGKIAYHLVEGA